MTEEKPTLPHSAPEFDPKTHVFNNRSGKVFEKPVVITRSQDGQYLEIRSKDGKEYRRQRMADRLWQITPSQYMALEALIANGWNKEIKLLNILGKEVVVGRDRINPADISAYGYLPFGFAFSQLKNVPPGIELDDFHTFEIAVSPDSPLANVDTKRAN